MSGWRDGCCLVGEVSHPYNSHNPYAVMTGFTGGQDQRDYYSSPTNHPSMGSVCHYAGLTQPGIPPYVVLPAFPGYSQGLRRAGPYGGYFGSRYKPPFYHRHPPLTRPPSDPRPYPTTLHPNGEPIVS